MTSGSPSIQKKVEIRQSKVHCTSMHNAIVKLGKVPVQHTKGRKAVEDSILHLHEVHHVPMTEKLMDMLRTAQPSQELLRVVLGTDC